MWLVLEKILTSVKSHSEVVDCKTKTKSYKVLKYSIELRGNFKVQPCPQISESLPTFDNSSINETVFSPIDSFAV